MRAQPLEITIAGVPDGFGEDRYVREVPRRNLEPEFIVERIQLVGVKDAVQVE